MPILNVDFLMILAGGIVSRIFEAFPGLSTWFDKLDSGGKKLVVVGSWILTAVLIMVSSCTGLFDLGLPCEQGSWLVLARLVVLCIAGGSATHLVFKDKPQNITLLQSTVEELHVSEK